MLSVASTFSNESLNSEETSNPEEIAREEKPNKVNGSIEENNNVQIPRHLESESNKSLEVADHKSTVPSFPVTRGVKGKSTRSSTRKTNCKYLSSKSENTEGKMVTMKFYPSVEVTQTVVLILKKLKIIQGTLGKQPTKELPQKQCQKVPEL